MRMDMFDLGRMDAGDMVKEALLSLEPRLRVDELSVRVHSSPSTRGWIIVIRRKLDFTQVIAVGHCDYAYQYHISEYDLRMARSPREMLAMKFDEMVHDLRWAIPDGPESEPEPEPETENPGVKLIDVRECGNCRAPVPQGATQCDHCGSYFDVPVASGTKNKHGLKPAGLDSGRALRVKWAVEAMNRAGEEDK